MKLTNQLLGLGLSILTSAPARAAENPLLQYTMKAIGADVDVVTEPTKAFDPADVLDGDILAAITRARTANFQLQLVIDRRGGEMLPAILVGLPQAEQAEQLKTLVDLLQQAQLKLKDAEAELLGEMPKLPENRNFRPLATTLAQLAEIVAKAHKIFKPQQG